MLSDWSKTNQISFFCLGHPNIDNRTVGDIRATIEKIQQGLLGQLGGSFGVSSMDQIDESTDNDLESGMESIIDNFAQIEPEVLEDVLGEPMIQSVNAFFVTADTCQSYLVCTDGTPAVTKDGTTLDCITRRQLVQTDLFSLEGTAPFDIMVLLL